MTGQTPLSTDLPEGGLDARRKKLLFRSWHRGMREMDLILGPFAKAELAGLTDEEIDQYEKLLDIPDTEFLPLVMGERPVPAHLDCPVLRKILASRRTMSF
jgi:antitoxin CptB